MDRQPASILRWCNCTSVDFVGAKRGHSGSRVGYSCNTCGKFHEGAIQYNFEGWHIAVEGSTAIARLLEWDTDIRTQYTKATSEEAIAAIETKVLEFNSDHAKIAAGTGLVG